MIFDQVLLLFVKQWLKKETLNFARGCISGNNSFFVISNSSLNNKIGQLVLFIPLATPDGYFLFIQ
jgi:hypothetical protein